jgi:protein gp37
MGADSLIEWLRYRHDGISTTGYTFNHVRGCTKVSQGCRNCYADQMSGRNPGTLGVWGPRGTRVIAAESYWRQPLRWNADALAAGERRKVFCASLADVFEGDDTMPAESREPVAAARERLWGLIEQTPGLDWLLLTKRPQNAARLAPARWAERWPDNVWLGTSVENQEAAEERIPELLKVPARVRFLSCEPLLGPVDLSRWVRAGGEPLDWAPDGDAPPGDYNPVLQQWETRADDGGIHWVIAGGESGPKARPMHPGWARSLRDQCAAAGVPYFYKQWGEWAPVDYEVHARDYAAAANGEGPWHREALIDQSGTVLPSDSMPYLGREMVRRFGKKAAGRLLDGQEHNAVPA